MEDDYRPFMELGQIRAQLEQDINLQPAIIPLDTAQRLIRAQNKIMSVYEKTVTGLLDIVEEQRKLIAVLNGERRST